MSSTSDERNVRIEKLKRIKEQDIDPYAPSFDRKNTVKAAFDSKIGTKVTVAGRIMTVRDMGKLCFAHIMDETHKMQIALQVDTLGKEEYKWFVKHIDIGDFVGISGEIFKTHKGELSILVSAYQLLTKAIRPLPEKWHGLADEETRLRKRYLDLIVNPDIKDLFYRKSIFWKSCRDFMIKKGFLEVETPVLEVTAGGADAEPFVTHHNALDLNVYLRISMGELWQKRLMVGGFESTFEIGRQFRNEGMSKEHLQDYTQMECYWAYHESEDMMRLMEEMYRYMIKQTYGKMKFKIGEFNVNFDKKWGTIDYVETIKEKFLIDVTTASKQDIIKKLKQSKIDHDPTVSKARLIDTLWKQVRKGIAGPVHLINHPVEVSPLAKRDPKNTDQVQRFQIIIAGSEMGNGYSELNDPLDQAERFEEQAKMREAGDVEAQMHDKDFVEALEYGMPPTAGFGFSERLFSFLENKTARECQLFPLMKPEDYREATAGKSKELMAAHAILLEQKKQPQWSIYNTIAHLCAAYGAHEGKQLFHLEASDTKDGITIPMNTQHAIMIKTAKTKEQIIKLFEKASDKKLRIEVFTQDMQDSTNDIKVKQAHAKKTLQKIDILGMLVYGEKGIVEKLTKDFPLSK